MNIKTMMDNDNDPNNNTATSTALSTPPSTSFSNDDNDNFHRATSEGSSRSGIQSSSLGGSASASALSSPLLNGEHIVLLSLSNDNTPINQESPAAAALRNVISTPRNINNAASERSGFEVIERRERERDDNPNFLMMASSTEISISPVAVDSADNDNTSTDDNIGNIIINDELLDNNNDDDGNNNNEAVYSPPPDSIIHSDLQSLSPPPLSFKSDSHHQYNVHHSPHSQSLFSGGGASSSSGLFDYANAAGAIAAQQQQGQGNANAPQSQLNQPPSTSSINNNKQQKQRPPLPPRWAIPTTTLAQPHMMGSNIVDGHPNNNYNTTTTNPPSYNPHPLYLPPKQVGPLSHRRVQSTGDASVMSVLTDPDSGLDTSPVLPQLGGLMSNEKNSFLPIQSMNARKRGVSWDLKEHYSSDGGVQHGSGGGGGGGSQFSTEEQAAFHTLGILQPLLDDDVDNHHDDDDGVGGGIGGFGLEGLMQPVLDDENPQTARQQTQRQQQEQQRQQSPPLPPENILPLKSPSKSSVPSPSKPNSSFSNNRRANYARSKRSQNMTSITQFEDEANLFILKALDEYKLEQKELLGHGIDVDDLQSQLQQQEEEEVGMEVEEGDEGEGNDLVGGIPHHVVRPTPTHLSVLSAISFGDGLDRSPSRHVTASGNDTSINTFEDAAWHEGYDSQGRIDGTLVEEQESKYIEEELGIDLNAGSKLGAAMMNNFDAAVGGDAASSVASSARKQVGQQQAASMSGSDQASVHSRGTDFSRGSKSSKASKGSKASNKERPGSPTKSGLRHRRGGTRGTGVLSAAQELAAMATIEELDESDNPFNLESDGHGVGNLIHGAGLILEQKERLEGDGSSDEDTPLIEGETTAAMDDESDAPRDEETGDATHNAKKQKRTPTHLFGRREKPTKKDRQMERRFRMQMWYDDLIAPRVPIFIKAATHFFMFVMLPLLFVAIILYYACGNPLAGGKKKAAQLMENGEFQGSWSWWMLFILRQFIVLSCVKAGEVISIDIIALRTPIFVKVFGSFATLMFVQARGWPYVVTFWGVFDILTLYGKNPFAQHWLFWQEFVGMCNKQNPAADFLHGSFYLRILLSMIFVGVITSLKRLMLATFLGRRSFAHYGPEFETILAKMILVSQVAHLARRIEANVFSPTTMLGSGYAYTMTKANFAGLASDSDDFEASSPPDTRKSVDYNSHASESPASQHGFGESLGKSVYGKKLISSMSRRNMMTSDNSSSKVEMMKLLEEWEEPDLQANAASKVSIKDILQFRQAMSLVSDTYPFTQAFGPASTRAICVESADQIFHLLLSKNPNIEQKLAFETLAELAQDKDGELIHNKVKALVRLFRPDRKGFLTKLDFITSIDQVYRELRLYRANLSNSQQINESFHGLINILHYFIVILVVLIIMGFNDWNSLLSMTTFFFSFSFMFGPASSKYFEGILLIFVRRPYDIGDKVAISDPETDTSASGSNTWFVEKVTLYATTVRFATTNEVATYSNGSLARLRIINAKRSPKAIVYVYNKFGSDVPFRMIQVFKASVENFVKSRPREWAQLNGFRATRVNLEFNFIEYVIVLTHRELWQNVAPILQSKADLASFCLEVSKKLNLRYEQPPKPIHLSLEGRYDDRRSVEGDGSLSSGLQQVREMFKKEE